MKKLRTLPLAISAMTLITPALFAPLAFVHKSDVRADLLPWSEPVRDDADAFSGLPHSIAFHSNRDGNNEIYAMNPDGSESITARGELRAAYFLEVEL